MIKVIPPDAWDFGEQPVRLVKAARGGLGGADYAALVKRAGHPLADWVRRHPPEPGDVYAHQIAMGSTETVGCFPAGSPVTTIDGLRPIEQITVGDKVLTHRNRYRPVTSVFRRPHTGDMVTVKATCLPRAATTTPEHPFWVVRKDDFNVRLRALSYLKKKGLTKHQAVDQAVAKAQFVSASDLKVGDFLIVPIRPEVGTPTAIPLSRAYGMGVYLAEGCVARKSTRQGKRIRSVVLTMSTNDTAVFDRLRRDTGKRLPAGRSPTSDKGVRINWNGAENATELHDLFGGDSRTKRLPPMVFQQSREWKLQFLAGYMDGDGCVTATASHSRYVGTVTGSTASLNLALDLQRLLASVNIASSVRNSKNRATNGCFGKTDLDIFQVSIGSAYSGELLDRCERLKRPQTRSSTPQSSMQIGQDYFLVPISSVTTNSAIGTEVFNFEVEEDNSYVVYSSVHNCNRNADSYPAAMLERDHPTFEKLARCYREHANNDPTKSYGVVKKAYYDPRMQRVELLVALSGTKEAARRNGGLIADREIDDLESGREYGVSMSCRVPYDQCNSCLNKAAHRGEYCGPEKCVKYGGCRDNLGKTFDDGFRLYVDNPSCRFFDISRVKRGADPTAFCTGKVASSRIPGGAELAEQLGLVLPEHAAPAGVASGLAVMRKLAALVAAPPQELTLRCRWDDVLAARGAGALDFSGSAYERHRKLAAAAEAGVLLPPAAWFAAATGVDAEKAAAVTADIRLSPAAFLARPDRCSRVAEALLEASDPDAAAKYAAAAPTPAAERTLAVRAACGAVKAAAVRAPVAVPPAAADEVAARYAAYTAAVFGKHAGTRQEVLILRDAVRNNVVRPD